MRCALLLGLVASLVTLATARVTALGDSRQDCDGGEGTKCLQRTAREEDDLDVPGFSPTKKSGTSVTIPKRTEYSPKRTDFKLVKRFENINDDRTSTHAQTKMTGGNRPGRATELRGKKKKIERSILPLLMFLKLKLLAVAILVVVLGIKKLLLLGGLLLPWLIGFLKYKHQPPAYYPVVEHISHPPTVEHYHDWHDKHAEDGYRQNPDPFSGYDWTKRREHQGEAERDRI